jgi:tetratricopeptide (TPR) repeat protein
MGWSGFVVRPFGVRKVVPTTGAPYQVDYERVQRELIDPAMRAAGIAGATTEVIIEAGNIREDMFQLLAHADIVIADISLHNANVFYELGARHALRPRRTFMIRFSGDEVPFDIKTDRYLGYDRDNPGASVAALTAGLKATLAEKDRVDSPIFNLLPALKAPSIKDLVPVPKAFREELAWALENKRIGHLVLLGEEANALPWGAEGLRGVATALFALKAFDAARQAWEAVRTRLDHDLEADLKLGTLHQRLKNLAASDSAIERALNDDPAITPSQRAEALSLRGSNAKQRWLESWPAGLPAADLGALALASDHLRQAAEAYAQAFDADLNHFYSGINALTMTRVQLDLAEAHPDAWTDSFTSDKDAERALEALGEQVTDLSGAVALSLRRAEQSLPPNSEDARWARCSVADAQLLRKERAARVSAGYRRALDGVPPFFFDSVNRQLDLFSRLGLFGDLLSGLRPVLATLEAAARQRPGAPAAATAKPPDRVLLFAGHRIDQPDRAQARFPAAMQATARQEIRSQIDRAISAWPPGTTVLGLAGGANGGDILFHEVCAELGIATELYLPMAPAAYIAESVRVDPTIDGTPSWIARFHAISQRCEAAGSYHQLGETASLPSWASRLRDYSIWERNNRWMLQSALAWSAPKLTLLVLWDGRGGDAPGGTQHMVAVAEAAGAVVRRIDSKALFGLA